MSDSIVIIGGGVAAARLVRAYREAGGDANLTMLSAETQLPYNRPPLSKGFLRGTIAIEDVFAEPATAYRELDVDVRLGASVKTVDTKARLVVTAAGTTLGYARLVLASGSLPRRLDIPGEGLEGVHTYRTLDDALAVREAATTARSAVVVGAGFIGMETAASLRTLGLEVTVIEPAEGLYARLANPELSRALARLYRDRGVEVILGDVPTAFQGRAGLEHVTTKSGRTIEAQLAIVGVGVLPSTTYLAGTELALEGGSVLVDEHFRTSAPGVFAIGDLARLPRPRRRPPPPDPALDERDAPRRAPRPGPRRRGRTVRPGRLLLHRGLRRQARPPRRPRRRPRPAHRQRDARGGAHRLLPRRRASRGCPDRRPEQRDAGRAHAAPPRPGPSRAAGVPDEPDAPPALAFRLLAAYSNRHGGVSRNDQFPVERCGPRRRASDQDGRCCSPAVTATGRRLAGGASGHAHRASYEHEGLNAKLKSSTAVPLAASKPRSAPLTVSSR